MENSAKYICKDISQKCDNNIKNNIKIDTLKKDTLKNNIKIDTLKKDTLKNNIKKDTLKNNNNIYIFILIFLAITSLFLSFIIAII